MQSQSNNSRVTPYSAGVRGLRRNVASFLCVLVLVSASTKASSGQTFVQLTDLGENVGPRLTRLIAQARIQRSLFGRIGSKVSYINNGVVYQLSTDPEWGRITIGNWNAWIHSYDNAGGPGGVVGEVEGVDVSARKNVYVADRDHARVLITTFDLSSGILTNPRSLAYQLRRPIDVAWDGGTTPLTSDSLYVLDDSLNSVTYWDLNSGVPGSWVWSYGTAGAGVGQFSRPSGICVGKTAATNGGTQFTNYFYVVDRGNSRLVWLSRGSAGANWLSSTTVSGWDPIDCAVDHFGNVYVVDRAMHRIHKFTYSLGFITSYGSYGQGANNYGTFAWPHAISVPCGLKVVSGSTVWYCEGRVVTAELWSDSSGEIG